MCGLQTVYEWQDAWSMNQWPGVGICCRCRSAARGNADPASRLPADPTRILSLLHDFHDATGIIPAPSTFHRISLAGESRERRALITAAQICIPHLGNLTAELGCSSWLGVLERAGIASATWRPSLGTLCVADDGHPCRSLGELKVDNWLHSHGIAHECEPDYPRDKMLNASGRRRADWRLEDGTFIEYAGLIGNRSYDVKLAEKLRLADLHNIEVIVLRPTDLLSLDLVFSNVVAEQG